MPITNFIIPAFICSVLIFGLIRGVDVFAAFIEGARGGIDSAISVLPALVALLTAVGMLRASGALDALTGLLAPAASAIGLPSEIIPQALLRPISGSGSLAYFSTLLSTHGADSMIGRVASVVQGSTETTFYTIAVYYGAAGITKTRYTIPCALSADFTAVALSAIAVQLTMYN